MSGHSKWSKIKRQKAATDSKRSKVWARLTRDITVAAREGGGDPSMNPRLALAVEKGKAENMPKDNIERAIKRGTGEIEGQDYEEGSYEGYAPGGVAVFIETLTDNSNRTVADLRSLFNKAGGSLGKAGSVAYLFDRKGLIEISTEDQDEMDLFERVVEAGAEDLEQDEDTFMVTTSVEAFDAVQTALEDAGVPVADARLVRLPTTTMKLDPDQARKILSFVERIEDHQDVQAVYTTLADDSILESV
jgi:YebC/PmpR family DNA-binding regulatory protein